MKKKTPCPPEAVQFNIKYADVKAGAKLVRDELKKNMSFLRKLGGEAAKLYEYGNENCYVEDDDGVLRAGGVKDLGIKMDDLDWLTTAHDELQSLVDNLNLG